MNEIIDTMESVAGMFGGGKKDKNKKKATVIKQFEYSKKELIDALGIKETVTHIKYDGKKGVLTVKTKE